MPNPNKVIPVNEIETETIIEEPIKQKNPSPITFDFTDQSAHEDDMSPVRDILAAGEQTANEEMLMDTQLLTVEEIATFLRCSYDVQGWFSYPELWKRDPQFFYEIAAGILPQLNAWAMRVPALAHAVKAVDAAGSWGKLIWDMAGTWIIIYRRKQLEQQKKKEESEGQQHAGYATNNQQPQPTTNNGKPTGFIIP